MQDEIQKLKYPIGEFELKEFSTEAKKEALNELKTLPEKLEQAVLNLNEAQLQTPYREGGWTINQVVHHIADSHINAYGRIKLGLTETETPRIFGYKENDWVNLPDVKLTPINVSITLLHALHRRIVTLLENTSDEMLKTKFVFHPEKNRNVSVWEVISIYAWHSKHHVAHITEFRKRMKI